MLGKIERFKTKATKWGIANEPLALKNDLQKFKHEHENMKIDEQEFFVLLDYLFLVLALMVVYIASAMLFD